MNTRLPRLFLYILLILVMATPSLPIARAQDGPPQVGLRPDAPPYALHGPYWVGTQTLEVEAGTEDARRFTVWYPALNPDGLEEAVTYVMAENHLLRQMLPPETPFTVLGHALEAAAPDPSAAPYPLVVFSHGFTAPMFYMYIGEHLASYGFVVIAPEHAQDTASIAYPPHVVRLFDIKRAIADAEVLTAEGGPLAGMIDVERIAVGGHSSGGMTAYAAAGAPMNWASIQQLCVEFPDIPDCTDLDSQYQQIVALLGTEADADGLFPAVWDSRVDAIFPLSGTVEMVGQRGLETVTVPMLTMFGSAEEFAPYMTPAYEYAASARKAQVVFSNASHSAWNNACDAYPYLVDYGLSFVCLDPVWDIARLHDLTNHFLTAFLLNVLKGEAEAGAALAPEAAVFPGIVYDAQGF